jgi:dihydroxyacetone kinase
MGLGMGIHGEPGLDERAIASADEIASMLVERLLLEAPDDASSKVAVIVNGLGSVKGEELFVFFNAVARLLAEHGIEIVEPEVGEFVTSFEMAGVSLTLTWLTDELEAAWRAPAAAPGYRKAAVVAKAGEDLDDDAEASALGAMRASASEGSRALAPAVARAFTVAAATIEAGVADLGALDSVAGDGDHGIGMQRGSAAAAEAARSAAAAGAGVGGVLEAAGSAWADRAGGTSGALWGLALRTAARRLGDELVPTKADAAAAVTAAVDAIQRTGKAELGDKTMLYAAIPFAQALSAPADGDLAAAWRHAAHTATLAAAATADLVPRMGRARPHQEKSVGHADPGAISLAMIVTAVGARDA